MIEEFDPLKGDILQVIDEKGQVQSKYEPSLSQDELKKIFSLMQIARAADLKAIKLQRQGRMGTYAPNHGQEGCQVGAGFAVHKNDWVFPHFRDLGLYLTLGFPLTNVYLYWMGHELGNIPPKGLNIFPMAVPVASHIPHAVGAGMAANIKKHRIAILCCFSDGGTSEGEFHEALNFAGVFKTPTVFVCYNNQYAISLPRKNQTAAKTLAQKAISYGFSGVIVDGNDPLAVYVATKEALDKARSGKGPTLIEAITYRMGDHTTSDDSSKYRSEKEVEEWRKKDPIQRFRIYLKNKGVWDEKYEKSVQDHVKDFISKSTEEAEQTPQASIDDIFKYTYKNMPPHLEKQREELKLFTQEKK
ncbi:pyruvate dehydrogenase (acetyl-transferring) E1 component subunit alpha [Acidobacteriota bacterium]